MTLLKTKVKECCWWVTAGVPFLYLSHRFSRPPLFHIELTYRTGVEKSFPQSRNWTACSHHIFNFLSFFFSLSPHDMSFLSFPRPVKFPSGFISNSEFLQKPQRPVIYTLVHEQRLAIKKQISLCIFVSSITSNVAAVLSLNLSDASNQLLQYTTVNERGANGLAPPPMHTPIVQTDDERLLLDSRTGTLALSEE